MNAVQSYSTAVALLSTGLSLFASSAVSAKMQKATGSVSLKEVFDSFGIDSMSKHLPPSPSSFIDNILSSEALFDAEMFPEDFADSEEKTLGEIQFEGKKFSTRNVAGDGDCLFRALSNQLGLIKEEADAYRFRDIGDSANLRLKISDKVEGLDGDVLNLYITQLIDDNKDRLNLEGLTREGTTDQDLYKRLLRLNAGTSNAKVWGTYVEAMLATATTDFEGVEVQLFNSCASQCDDCLSICKDRRRFANGEELSKDKPESAKVVRIGLKDKHFFEIMPQAEEETATEAPESGKDESVERAVQKARGVPGMTEKNAGDLSVMIEIRNYIEELRKENENIKKVTIPKFVIVGEQSAGKSRLIESLAKQRFTYSQDKETATTRPTVIRFENDSTLTANKFYLAKHAPGTVALGDQYVELSEEQLLKEMKKLHGQEALARAKVTGMKFSPNEIFMKIRGPGLYDIEVIDLPGFTSASGLDNAEEDERKEVLTIAKKYVSDKNNQIIIVDVAVDNQSVKVYEDFLYDTRGTNGVGSLLAEGEDKIDFLQNRVISVRTKLDLYDLRVKFEDDKKTATYIQGTTSNASVPPQKKFLLSLPHFSNKEASTVNASKFQGLLEKCDADDSKMLRESIENDELYSAFQPLIGFKNFANGLHQQFKVLFMKEKTATQEALDVNLKKLDAEIEEMQGMLDREESGDLADAAHHFSRALSTVATTTGQAVWYPSFEEKYDVLDARKQYVGTSLKSDIIEFEKSDLLKDEMIYGDVAKAYNKLVAEEKAAAAAKEATGAAAAAGGESEEGKESEGSGSAVQEESRAMRMYKSEYIISGFKKHTAAVNGMDEHMSYFEKNNYGESKLTDTLRELRSYIRSQTLTLDLADYEKFVKNQPYQVIDTSFYAEQERRKLFENFISNRISEILQLNMNVVGHRIVRLFEEMADPAVYWLIMQLEQPTNKRLDMKELVHVGMKLRDDETFKTEFKENYKLYLKKELYAAFKKHTDDDITFFCASNPLKLLETSSVNALNNDPFDASAGEADNIEIIRRQMIAQRVEAFFKNDDNFIDGYNFTISQQKTAESMKTITEEVWKFALLRLADNLGNMVNRFFTSQITTGTETALEVYLKKSVKGLKKDQQMIDSLKRNIAAKETDRETVRGYLSKIVQFHG